MALDGILLSKITPEIQDILPARIQKIHQISETEVLFHLHCSKGKKQLLISCHSQYNRILLTERNYPTPSEPGHFVMVLRKYLENSQIIEFKQAELDRWCHAKIKRRNDLGDIEFLNLYIELMGKYANLILVNDNQCVIDAMKRIPPFENTRRVIHPGAEFIPTPAQNKKNPFTDTFIDSKLTLTQQFAGFSPLLSKEIEYRMSAGQTFSSILSEIQQSSKLFISEKQSDSFYHCINLTHIGGCKAYPMFDGFDIIYFHKEEKDRIKQIAGDIYHTVKKELKHQKQKLPRLITELDEANDCDKWKKYGDLLYIHQIDYTKGKTSINVFDYETNEEISIPLDTKLDGKRNAQKCYARYNKLKKGKIYLKEQISICEKEIDYFQGLLEQLEYADFDTAVEIQKELVAGGYMKDMSKKQIKRQKDTGLKLQTITLENGVKISFGKNNLQNDFLTWHKAKKSEIWLHTKDYHGAHVVIHESNPDEETMRIAAMIASYFSMGRNSSSVPVNWCSVAQLKKIPGAKPGMVQLSSYKTIYIDPDTSILEAVGISIA